jgi:hypothetical protein
MMVLAVIGAKALYLLFVWLLSAAIGSWMSERKGYGERVGLAFGLILSAIGLLIVLLLPGRPRAGCRVGGVPLLRPGKRRCCCCSAAVSRLLLRPNPDYRDRGP